MKKLICPREDTTTIIFDNFIYDRIKISNCELENYSINIKFLNNYCNKSKKFVTMGIFGMNRTLLKNCYQNIKQAAIASNSCKDEMNTLLFHEILSSPKRRIRRARRLKKPGFDDKIYDTFDRNHKHDVSFDRLLQKTPLTGKKTKQSIFDIHLNKKENFDFFVINDVLEQLSLDERHFENTSWGTKK